jgi:DNA polymerase/3'-5' exonuclease PolX
MTAAEAAAILAEIAMLTEVVGGDPFRARAYAGAARRLEGSGADIEGPAPSPPSPASARGSRG